MSQINDIEDEIASMDRLSEFIDQGPAQLLGIGMLAISVDGTILHANHKAETMFGYGQGEMRGRHFESLIPQRFRPHHKLLSQEFYGAPSRRLMCDDSETRVMEDYEKTLPKDVLDYVDQLDAAMPRRGRPKSLWHGLAFQKVEQLRAEGLSLNMAYKKIEEKFLVSRNLRPGALRTAYNRAKQAALADSAAAAVLDGEDYRFAAAWEQLKARENKDRSRK